MIARYREGDIAGTESALACFSKRVAELEEGR